MRAFLWHQGESDVYWGHDYAGLLDCMINNIRRVVAGVNGHSIPFLLGQFVPYEVNYNHSDAAGQRELGKRYFKVYQLLGN